MPARNTVNQVPLYAPDNPPIVPLDTEISIRADTADLWSTYRNLSEDKRVQFLQAAAKWQEAIMHWQNRPSLSFTLMVIACEALKPSDADDRLNCYDVIKTLSGPAAVDRIRQNPFPAQRIRSSHLHSGAFHGLELERMNILPSYQDPSFREAHGEMARVTPAAIIEWLKRQGTIQMPSPKDQRTVRRWLKDNILVSAVTIFGFGLAVGWVLSVSLP